MPASTVTLRNVVDDAMRFGDIKPVLQVAGSSQEPALTIANDVMNELVSVKFNWKWNAFNVPVFQTISWQNDYAVPGITNLGWLVNGVLIDINNTQIPKRKYVMECVRDLQPTSASFGRPFQASWLDIRNMLFGSWGSGATTPNTNNTGQTNPGPGIVYTQPLGAASTPSNPVTQIIDSNGNSQVIDWTFIAPGATGTCGGSTPAWPAANSAAGVTTLDGSVRWVTVDPYGQGIRLQMIPAQAGVVWQIMLTAQFKPVRFTSLGQTLNPMPDDFSSYFMQGFRAYCYQRSPEDKIRAKFAGEYALWQKKLSESEAKADRETESFGAYPSTDIMGGWGVPNPGPAWPYTPYS